MEILSVRDYRNNLASYFDRASDGERVIIRRKNALYALISIENNGLTLSPQQQKQIDELTQSLHRGMEQAKQMQSGKIPFKRAIDLIDEL